LPGVYLGHFKITLVIIMVCKIVNIKLALDP